MMGKMILYQPREARKARGGGSRLAINTCTTRYALCMVADLQA
jgi:hypothetical protein